MRELRRLPLAIYSLVLGACYLVLGVAEIVMGVLKLIGSAGLSLAPFVPPDVFGGFSSCVIGVTLALGYRLRRSEVEGLPFVLVGTLLAGIFGVLYILIALAHAASSLIAVLSGEAPSLEWVLDFLRLEIPLFFASLPLAVTVWSYARRRY